MKESRAGAGAGYVAGAGAGAGAMAGANLHYPPFPSTNTAPWFDALSNPLNRSSAGTPFIGSLLCGNCADGQPVSSRCRDCSEDLCDTCVMAHKRIKIAYDHTIIRYPASAAEERKRATARILLLLKECEELVPSNATDDVDQLRAALHDAKQRAVVLTHQSPPRNCFNLF